MITIWSAAVVFHWAELVLSNLHRAAELLENCTDESAAQKSAHLSTVREVRCVQFICVVPHCLIKAAASV